MSIHVTPADLRTAAGVVNNAVAALGNIQTQGTSAKTDATEIHYEPAAGKADAVAQKALENLQLANDALNGLIAGLNAAADKYSHNDHVAKGAFTKKDN